MHAAAIGQKRREQVSPMASWGSLLCLRTTMVMLSSVKWRSLR